MAKVFISYRRADSKDMTARIHRELAAVFGDDVIFLDTEDLLAGANWQATLEAAIINCEIMLVMIGKQWASITDDAGTRRLDKPDDVVRREIEMGINHNKKIIPILLDGAPVPKKSELPDILVVLTSQQGISIRNTMDFSDDVAKLIKALKQYIGDDSSQKKEDTQLVSTLSEQATTLPPAVNTASANRGCTPVRVGIFVIGIISFIASITGIISFFFPDFSISHLWNGDSPPLPQRAVYITIVGEGERCPTYSTLHSGLVDHIASDVVIVDTAEETNRDGILGSVHIVVDCRRNVTDFEYQPIGTLLNLRELETITIAGTDNTNIVNVALALLAYLDITERSAAAGRFDNLIQQIPSVNNTSSTTFEPLGLACLNNPALMQQPLPPTTAQIIFMRGNSLLFTNSNTKYDNAFAQYRRVWLNSPEYSELAQLNMAYTLLNEMIGLFELLDAEDAADVPDADDYSSIEADAHCLLDAILTDSDSDVMKYYAHISLAHIEIGGRLVAAVGGEELIADITAPRFDNALAHCDAASELTFRIDGAYRYLADLCFGTVHQAESHITSTPTAPYSDLRNLLHINQDVSQEEGSLMDVLYWKTNLAYYLKSDFTEPVETCIAYRQQLDRQLGTVNRQTSATTSSPLPETYQLLDRLQMPDDECGL